MFFDFSTVDQAFLQCPKQYPALIEVTICMLCCSLCTMRCAISNKDSIFFASHSPKIYVKTPIKNLKIVILIISNPTKAQRVTVPIQKHFGFPACVLPSPEQSSL